MTHITCRLTVKNWDQLRNSTLGSRVWATFTLFCYPVLGSSHAAANAGSATLSAYVSLLLFPVWCYAGSRASCVCRKLVFYRNRWTNRAVFLHGSFFPPILHCVIRKLRYLQNTGTSHWTFAPISGLRQFRHGTSIVEACYQLSSKKVDAQTGPSSVN